MPLLIAHRINTIEQLKSLDPKQGIEFDIRDSGGKCVVTHDPYTDGPELSDFFQYIGIRFCIFNIKSEGIEYEVLKLIKQYNLTNYFFLDCSIPMMVKLSTQGEKNLAIRFSEVEPIELAYKWKGRINWIWIDCFTSFILTKEIQTTLHSYGFNLCIVSPELQGRPGDIKKIKDIIKKEDIHIDSICSKIAYHSEWSN